MLLQAPLQALPTAESVYDYDPQLDLVGAAAEAERVMLEQLLPNAGRCLRGKNMLPVLHIRAAGLVPYLLQVLARTAHTTAVSTGSALVQLQGKTRQHPLRLHEGVLLSPVGVHAP